MKKIKPVVVLIYEHVSREYQSLSLLKKDLQTRFDFEVYIFSIHFQILDLFLLSKRKRISIIVMPYIYKESSIFPISFLLRSKKPPTIINLHHEQLGAEYDSFRYLPLDEFSKNYVYHFVWTNKFKDSLIKIGVFKKLIHITGNIRVDLLTNNAVMNRNKKTFLTEKFNLNPSKKILMIVESGIDLLSESKIHNFVLKGYKENDLRELNNEILNSRTSTKEDLNLIDNKLFDKFEIIYRSHPGTKNSLTFDNRIHCIDDYSIYDWLPNIDYILSRQSTVLFEGLLSNKICIRYDPSNLKKKFLNYGLELFPRIESINEILDLDETLYLNKVKNIKTKNYLGLSDGRVIFRISSLISDIIKQDPNISFYSLGKKSYIFKKIISNIFSRFLFSYNLTYLFKFSLPLKRLIRDIPPTWKK